MKVQKLQRNVSYVSSGRAGESDFLARIPALSFLRKKRVGIIGLGAIGATVAMELGRSCIGELSLLDGDSVDPGTFVRWPLGYSVSGDKKVIALQNHFKKDYPLTKVNPFIRRIGLSRRPNDCEPTDQVIIDRAFGAVDAIIDASTELSVHQCLSIYARQRKVPYIFGFLTVGALAGLVANFDPQKQSGCWFCLQIALYDKQQKCIQELPFKDQAQRQPPGCAERTSTFPGFDASEVSMEIVRQTISALSGAGLREYPRQEYDVAIVNFQTAEGLRTAPSWTSQKLPSMPGCPYCN